MAEKYKNQSVKKFYYKQRNNEMLLKFVFEDSKFPKFVSKVNAEISEDFDPQVNTAYLYVDKKHQNLDDLAEITFNLASSLKRSYQIDVESLLGVLDLKQALRMLISKSYFATSKLFKKSEKNDKNDKQNNKPEPYLSFLIPKEDPETTFFVHKLITIASAVAKTRNLQITPENFLNSEILADEIESDFKNIPNLKVRILTKYEIKKLGMNLLLSVNKGSTHEPRVVVVEYNGDSDTEEKTVFVGKGITFDTGGVNTKGYHMGGMKFDMSGSAITAYAVKVLAQLQTKVNVAAVMCITDNRINDDASLPENVYRSMSGKWVEVVDTDAEGRLVLADGIYYAAKKLKATTILDVATLTGAMPVALGHIYTGIWSTNDAKYEIFQMAAKEAQEKVWRMPLHEDFNKGNKSSKVADLANWSSKVRSDSNQAAMFLKEFTNGVDFIHCDIAGTADINGNPQGVLVATLVEFGIKMSLENSKQEQEE